MLWADCGCSLLQNCSLLTRPHPRHGEARRRGHHVAASPIVGRALADVVAEGSAEGAQARETDIEADIGDVALRFPEQEHRSLDATPLEVAVGCLPEGRLRGEDVVSEGDYGDFGKCGIILR